jgi:membrane fusion protein (multidrug efflux system)
MAKARFWLVLAAVAAAASGALYYYPNIADRAVLSLAKPSSARTDPPPAPAATVVEAAPGRVATVVDDLQAIGTLRPDVAVTVAPEIAGRIERIRFREGQKVAAGDVLVELDASILRAELAKSRSDLTLARANHTRSVTLAREGMTSLRVRDETLAALETAQAGIALVEARQDKMTIRAPLSGVVGLRSVSVGAYVTPGQAIVELADIDPIKLDFRVPELALSELRSGQAVRVTVDPLPGKVFEGKVYAIDPIVDVSGRAIRLRARIPNPDGQLSPGLFARVEIVVGRRENAILVPESAVFARSKKRFVYRVVDDRARLTEVELGARRPGQVEVRTGLRADDVVISAGHQQVRDGASVEVISPAAAA